MTYPNTPLHIDIPVKLAEVKAVFSVAALSFEGTCLRRDQRKGGEGSAGVLAPAG